LKKPASSVRFRFYKQKTKKTEPKSTKNRKKLSQPEKIEPKLKNQAKPVFSLKNQTEPKPVGLTRFRFFFKKNFDLVTFFYKN
jgi:hypothetical protein